MPKLRAIDGGKEQHAKRVAEAHFVECRCIPEGCRSFVEVRTGILRDKKGKVIHKGTPSLVCTNCGKQQD